MSLIKRFTTRNVGNFDRVLRTLPFVAFAILFMTGSISGVTAIVAGVVSVMLLFTAITGLCSIYSMFGVSTCKARSE